MDKQHFDAQWHHCNDYLATKVDMMLLEQGNEDIWFQIFYHNMD